MKEALPHDIPPAFAEADSLVLRSELLNRLKCISQAIKDRVNRLVGPEDSPKAEQSQAQAS